MKSFFQSLAIMFAGFLLWLGITPPNMPPLPPEVEVGEVVTQSRGHR